MNTPPSTPASHTLTAADGYPLQALHYGAQGTSKGRMIVAGATGVPQGFYRRFAEFASTQGYHVLTLDYRGIGQSKPATLKGFEMNYLDWATLDLAAAVEHMASDTEPLFMVGHSFGGHAFGLLPNHARVSGMYTFGTGAGWHGWMPPLERIKVQFMWRIVGPLLTRWKGYLAWSRMGMGEDLPMGVYNQWRRWCSFPRYFFEDPKMQHVVAQFDSVRTPIVAVNAIDDLWASPRSRDAFMQGYRHTQYHAVDVQAQLLGMSQIGHMGYFRPSASALWQGALDWFQTTPTISPRAL